MLGINSDLPVYDVEEIILCWQEFVLGQEVLDIEATNLIQIQTWEFSNSS